MKRFEYVQLEWYNIYPNTKGFIAYEKWLDQQGQKGWELVESKPVDNGYWEGGEQWYPELSTNGDLICTFKRELSGERDV